MCVTYEQPIPESDQILITQWLTDAIHAEDPEQEQAELVLSDGFSCQFSTDGRHRYQKIAREAVHEGDVTPALLLLAGISESGKSEIGKTLLGTNMANRIKILRVTREEFAPELANVPTQSGKINKLLNSLQPADMARIAERLKVIISGTHCPLAVIETIKSPRVVQFFSRLEQDCNALTIFVDADYELRLAREMSGKGISDRERVREMIRQKDLEKATFGNESIRDIADLRIINNGNVESLRFFMQSFVQPILAHRYILGTMHPIFYG